jgi:hypothetical protein
MMGNFRWYVARCEETPSGHWRIDPSVVLPNGAHLRYFHIPTRKDIALVRVHHTESASLDTFDANETPLKIKRIPMAATWATLKNLNALTTILGEMNVNMSAIPDTMTGSEIINRIGRKLSRFERKRVNDKELSFLRDGVEE